MCLDSHSINGIYLHKINIEHVGWPAISILNTLLQTEPQYPQKMPYVHSQHICLSLLSTGFKSSSRDVILVMSHNTYVTLLTNPSQSQILSHLSRHHHTSSPNNIRLFKSQSVLLFYVSVLVPNYC